MRIGSKGTFEHFGLDAGDLIPTSGRLYGRGRQCGVLFETAQGRGSSFST